MNLIAEFQNPPAAPRISHARRCADAIDQIEPDDNLWDDDEIARMVQFNGMIEYERLICGND